MYCTTDIRRLSNELQGTMHFPVSIQKPIVTQTEAPHTLPYQVWIVLEPNRVDRLQISWVLAQLGLNSPL